jgi:hypothetical protein
MMRRPTFCLFNIILEKEILRAYLDRIQGKSPYRNRVEVLF